LRKFNYLFKITLEPNLHAYAVTSFMCEWIKSRWDENFCFSSLFLAYFFPILCDHAYVDMSLCFLHSFYEIRNRFENEYLIYRGFPSSSLSSRLEYNSVVLVSSSIFKYAQYIKNYVRRVINFIINKTSVSRSIYVL
jgi:hypothetical protein